MKWTYFSVVFATFLLLNCNSKEEIEVGEIIERTPEEIAKMKDFAASFTFQSIDGNQVSLADFKGKYVYIDIWATWCRPCLQQLPAMKEMEEKYRGTNIEFVSISVDNDRDKEKWANMVREKEMKGVQLFAGRGTTFHRDYKISTIPKFLIIGPEGEIINADAPRPMDYRTGGLNQELVAILDSYLQ